ncbi:MAG: ferrous iron transport protein B [Candidatus Margulisiibacteriota bacterium]|jgi:ferrous iron transport protein B
MAKIELTVAIAGNPNSGKTSLFNILAGAHQHVGNWPGVTVEKKEGFYENDQYKIKLVDLPGTYSLSAYSQEELITRNFILRERPDLVIDVLDATNIERHLYFAVQLMELACPVVLALNMWDEVEASGIKIDHALLSSLLGVPIVPISAVKEQGIEQLLGTITGFASSARVSSNKLEYQADLSEEIDNLALILAEDQVLAKSYPLKWLALKLIEQDQEVYQLVHERAVWLRGRAVLEKAIKHLQGHFDRSPESIVSESRYAFINGAVKETVQVPLRKERTLTEIIDSILLNQIVGLPIFLFLLWLVFQATFRLGKIPMDWIEQFFVTLGNLAVRYLPDSTLTSLLRDGVIAGVGGVLVFVPAILLLFFAISILEDSGYMARAAFLVDRIMHRFGLHGRSFIPMVLGFGCSVPAFMACRTLKNEADRLTTMLVIPFLSCSAKIPVYVLLIGAFFPVHMQGNIMFGLYMLGVVIALIASALLKRFLFKGLSEPFVMELPPYRLPTARNILLHMWERAAMYIRKAGTFILVASVIVWVCSNLPSDRLAAHEHKEKVLQINSSATLSSADKEAQLLVLNSDYSSRQLAFSISGRAGHLIEPLIRPLGFDWKMGIALISGVAAKEIIVSTLGTIYSLENSEKNVGDLQRALRNDPAYNPLAILALLVFTLLYVPCIAASTVFHKEAGHWKWTVFYIIFSTATAYFMALIVYQGGKLLGY